MLALVTLSIVERVTPTVYGSTKLTMTQEQAFSPLLFLTNIPKNEGAIRKSLLRFVYIFSPIAPDAQIPHLPYPCQPVSWSYEYGRQYGWAGSKQYKLSKRLCRY